MARPASLKLRRAGFLFRVVFLRRWAAAAAVLELGGTLNLSPQTAGGRGGLGVGRCGDAGLTLGSCGEGVRHEGAEKIRNASHALQIPYGEIGPLAHSPWEGGRFAARGLYSRFWPLDPRASWWGGCWPDPSPPPSLTLLR